MGGKSVEEERRLFYVAMTRAMKALVITLAQGRMLWGSVKFNAPSQFLSEIPEHHLKWHRPKVAREESRRFGESFDDDFDQRPRVQEDIYIQKRSPSPGAIYPVGIQVIHALYGNGKVVESEGTGQDEKALIQFRDGMKKRFMVKFSPLQRIEEELWQGN
jgi:DNA helicase-2/ATP-dependent DNA helicase PcrA